MKRNASSDRSLSGIVRFLSRRLGGAQNYGQRADTAQAGCRPDESARQTTEQELLNLGGRLIWAQEAERNRIARELHDNLSQSVALLAIEIDQLAQKSSLSAPEISSGLRKALRRAQEISAEVHRISYELHPSKLDRLGLETATRSLCEEVSRQQNVHLDYSFKDVPASVPHDVSLCLYRIVQESLQNIVKHSGVRSATVELVGTPTEIRLIVADPGVGFDPDAAAKKDGLGLLSMRERTRLVGGTFSIESKPSCGTRIRAVVPLLSRDNDRGA